MLSKHKKRIKGRRIKWMQLNFLKRWSDIYNKGNCKYGKGDGLRMCVECWDVEVDQ